MVIVAIIGYSVFAVLLGFLFCLAPCILPGFQHRWGDWEPTDSQFKVARYCKNCTRKQTTESDWWTRVQAPPTEPISLHDVARQQALLPRT
jgi:hypothetical protein